MCAFFLSLSLSPSSVENVGCVFSLLWLFFLPLFPPKMVMILTMILNSDFELNRLFANDIHSKTYLLRRGDLFLRRCGFFENGVDL